MPARKFFYFFYGDLIPSGLPPGDDPRRFLSHRADGILSAVLEAGPSGLGYREACVRYPAGLVDGLIRAGLFRVEAGGLRLDAPVFLREDAGALTHFLAGEIPPLAGRLEAALPALHAAICPLDNGFDEKVNLYHLLCGAVLDGTFFDYLSARGVLAESRVHPSGLDYILTVYEDAPELNHFSNRLLCSCNRLSDGRRSLQSFGDADGERLDFYRFFNWKQAGRVPEAYRKVGQDWDAALGPAAGESPVSQILDAAEQLAAGGHCAPPFLRLLEDFGYCAGGAYCVPVYRRETEAVLQQLFTAVSGCIGEAAGELLARPGLYAALSVFPHGVSREETANELYHIVFGLLNEELAARGIAASPPYRQGEGRYLKAFFL